MKTTVYQPAYLLSIDSAGACTLSVDGNAVPDYWGWVRSAFAGRRLPDDWKIPRHIVGSPNAALRDFTAGYSDAPFVTQRVVDALAGSLAGAAEFRKVGCIRHASYYAMNVIAVVDCVDAARSGILERRDGAGQPLLVDRVVFRAEKWNEIKAMSIFKVPEDFSKVFVTDVFVGWVRQFAFTGVDFVYADRPGLTRRNSVYGDLPLR